MLYSTVYLSFRYRNSYSIGISSFPLFILYLPSSPLQIFPSVLYHVSMVLRTLDDGIHPKAQAVNVSVAHT